MIPERRTIVGGTAPNGDSLSGRHFGDGVAKKMFRPLMKSIANKS